MDGKNNGQDLAGKGKGGTVNDEQKKTFTETKRKRKQ